MAIHRAPRPDHHFTQIRNDVLRDERLSYRARGLLAFILSNSDGWATDSLSLAREHDGERRDGIRTALTELEAAGYLVREKRQDGRGRWSTQSVIYDTPRQPELALFEVNPQVTPRTAEPAPGEPTPGEPTPGEPSVKKNTTNEQPPTGGADKRTPAQQIAAAIYDHAEGMVAFMAMHQIATRALKIKGATVETVSEAMVKLYDAGRPLTLQTVGQELGARRSGSFKVTNDAHWANGGGF